MLENLLFEDLLQEYTSLANNQNNSVNVLLHFRPYNAITHWESEGIAKHVYLWTMIHECP